MNCVCVCKCASVLCLYIHVCVCLMVFRSNKEVLDMIQSGQCSVLTLSQVTILWQQAPDEKDVCQNIKTAECIVCVI